MAVRRIGGLVAIAAMLASLLAFLPTTSVAAQGAAVTVAEGESIQAALDAAEPGTTITVEAGVYDEALVIRTDGITLRGEEGAVISPGDATSECEFFGFYDAICIAADYFVNEAGQSDSNETIYDVTVSGFTINNVGGAGVGVVRGDNITISDNSVTKAGCDSFYVISSNDFEVSRNVSKKASQVLGFCNGITVVNSTDGLVSRNKVLNGAGTAILVNDSHRIRVERSKVVGNCNGIIMTQDPGFPRDLKNIKITNNTISRNNKTCQSFLFFGIELTTGGVGIGTLGGDKIQIKNNKVTKNVVNDDQLLLDGSGIAVGDDINIFSGEFRESVGRVSVNRNKVTGNIVNGVETDIAVDTVDGNVKVNRNTCGVSSPDPAWCGG